MENAEIHMKMDNVEFFRAPRDAIQHHQVRRKGIHASRIETQRATARGSEPRLRLRVAAGKQSDLMTLAYQLFGQIRDNAVGAAVKLRWTTLVQR